MFVDILSHLSISSTPIAVSETQTGGREIERNMNIHWVHSGHI